MERAGTIVEQAKGRSEAAKVDLRRAEAQMLALLREDPAILAQDYAILTAKNDEIDRLYHANLCAQEQITALKDDVESIRSERELMQGKLEEVQTELDEVQTELDLIHHSLAWALLAKGREFHGRLFREGTIRGRCWSAFVRFAKQMLVSGHEGEPVPLAEPTPLAAEPFEQVKAQIAQSEARRPAALPRTFGSFDELPWQLSTIYPTNTQSRVGYYKVLLIAAGPTTPDEPSRLLRLSTDLARNSDFDCRIVLEDRDDLLETLARVVPTFELNALLQEGLAHEQAYDLIADLFARSANHCVAIAGTAVPDEFVSALSSRGISVLSWFDEPPPGPGEIGEILAKDHGYFAARPLNVSVIVPNYNHGSYLEERLLGIFNQTYKPHEIIFLDDASVDESVELVKRLAARSPVPFRLIKNDTNSGSTFRQWVKGINLATGDLIWIAESDDACRPEFLERLVPEFYDAEVVLAYSQSMAIGPDGEKLFDDYRFITDEVAPSHWQRGYCTPGIDEVELALSQKNTIPNASAVVFRKPDQLDFAEHLEQLRLAGDWLFYAMRIRDGKIAHVPDALNFHRHHDKTVRHAFESASALFEEQLAVKARIFESIPVSANAMSRSLACTIREYTDKTKHLGPQHPAMNDHPKLAPLLGRIRFTFRTRLAAPDSPRILIVLDDMDYGAREGAAIPLANALTKRFQVFICNTRQWIVSPDVVARLDDRIAFLEGTLGQTPWTFAGDSDRDGTSFDAVPSPRAEVIEELIRFHRIDVIHSHGWWADRLVHTVKLNLHVPWLIGLGLDESAEIENLEHEAAFERLVAPLLAAARGAFDSRTDDLLVALGGTVWAVSRNFAKVSALETGLKSA
jgi:hypothetical protein